MRQTKRAFKCPASGFLPNKIRQGNVFSPAMNVSAILKYEKEASEDYYGILGCDPSSGTDQILAEFKVRARELHPDKSTEGRTLQSQEKFKLLLEVLCLLTWDQITVLIDFCLFLFFADF
jgi:hypothetical protein